MRKHSRVCVTFERKCTTGSFSILGVAHAKSVVERGEKDITVHSPHLKSLSKTMMAGIVTFKIALGGHATGHCTGDSCCFQTFGIRPDRRIYRMAVERY